MLTSKHGQFSSTPTTPPTTRPRNKTHMNKDCESASKQATTARDEAEAAEAEMAALLAQAINAAKAEMAAQAKAEMAALLAQAQAAQAAVELARDAPTVTTRPPNSTINCEFKFESFFFFFLLLSFCR
jgi:hypothetical protein